METDGTRTSTILSWLVIAAMITLAIVLAVTIGHDPYVTQLP